MYVCTKSILLKLVSYFFSLACCNFNIVFSLVLLCPCSPVNLLTPARFRIVYAFMFGSMSANLLDLIATGFMRIPINVIFLDIIFNTSKY